MTLVGRSIYSLGLYNSSVCEYTVQDKCMYVSIRRDQNRGTSLLGFEKDEGEKKLKLDKTQSETSGWQPQHCSSITISKSCI